MFGTFAIQCLYGQIGPRKENNMVDLFKDVIHSILRSKNRCIHEDNEKEYVPFVVNRALSFHQDCVWFANEMNKNPHLDKLLQYDFLLNTVRGYKREFAPWIKREKNKTLEALKQYYGFSNEKARDALNLLSNEQINEIIRNSEKGGVENAKSRRTDMGDAGKA